MAVKGPFIQRLVRRVFYRFYARNLLFELQVRARSDSADYVEAHMTAASLYENADEYLRDLVQRAPDGALLEFGVATGGTINQIARAAPGCTVHGFDSFEGLPEDWTGHNQQRGAFGRGGKAPRVEPTVRLHKGWFSDTIGVWKAEYPEKAGFIHVDCDIYSSTKDVLWSLRDRLQVGTVIAFDEYFNYPNWRQHEARALAEFVAEFGITYRYIAYTAVDGAVAIEITGLG